MSFRCLQEIYYCHVSSCPKSHTSKLTLQLFSNGQMLVWTKSRGRRWFSTRGRLFCRYTNFSRGGGEATTKQTGCELFGISVMKSGNDGPEEAVEGRILNAEGKRVYFGQKMLLNVRGAQDDVVGLPPNVKTDQSKSWILKKRIGAISCKIVERICKGKSVRI